MITLFIFKWSFVVADEIKEPSIITINNELLVYEEVAKKIISNANVNGLIVRKKDDKNITILTEDKDALFKKILRLRDEAKESGWIFGECENGSGRKNLGINVDKNRNLVKDIVLCSN